MDRPPHRRRGFAAILAAPAVLFIPELCAPQGKPDPRARP